ncbi:MAG: hypothetical protein P8Q23_10120 [Paracoccaceae bacterium]|nr:hypothetical protein [Paracoccaceae bacterium]
MLDGADTRQWQEKAKVIGEVFVGAGNRFTRGQVFGLKVSTVRREYEFGFSFGGRWAGLQFRQSLCDIALVTDGNVDVVGLKNASKIGLVGSPGAQPFERRGLVPECFEENIRELLRVERLLRKCGNGFFNFDGVQGSMAPMLFFKL